MFTFASLQEKPVDKKFQKVFQVCKITNSEMGVAFLFMFKISEIQWILVAI